MTTLKLIYLVRAVCVYKKENVEANLKNVIVRVKT